jgi:inosine-uridine nucleoside N-ribohydrolase
MDRKIGPQRSLLVLVLGTAIALLASGCGGATSSSPGSLAPTGAVLTSAPPSGPETVVIDTDVGADDLLAMTFLLSRGDPDVAAITVSGTGLAHCGPGSRTVQNLVNELMREPIPVACGRETALGNGTPFPDDWRQAADGGFGLKLAGASGTPQGKAVDILREAITTATGPVTLLTLGPLTNVADLFQASPDVVGRLSRIVAMAGAVDVDGNVSIANEPTAMEWNLYADPVAADVVLRSGVPMTFVALDATKDVPVTEAFGSHLETDTAAGGASIADELWRRNAYAIGLDSFWDPLAAVTVVDPSPVTLEEATISVTTSGKEAGRTVRDVAGTNVTLATAADPAAFETVLLAGLRSSGPRRTPLTVAGSLMTEWDGTTCRFWLKGGGEAGTYELTGTTTTTVEMVVSLVRLNDGVSQQDVLDWVDHHSEATEPPDHLVTYVGQTNPATATASTTSLVDLVAGTYVAGCVPLVNGQWDGEVRPTLDEPAVLR